MKTEHSDLKMKEQGSFNYIRCAAMSTNVTFNQYQAKMFLIGSFIVLSLEFLAGRLLQCSEQSCKAET